jgi:hypothetical protein
MKKIQYSQILVEGKKIKSGKVTLSDLITRSIEDTYKKQAQVIKLKQLEKDELSLMVQI